jgi:hypothetical protein
MFATMRTQGLLILVPIRLAVLEISSILYSAINNYLDQRSP